MIHKAQANPKQVVFPEGDNEKILRACHALVEEAIGKPILATHRYRGRGGQRSGHRRRRCAGERDVHASTCARVARTGISWGGLSEGSFKVSRFQSFKVNPENLSVDLVFETLKLWKR
jgi:Phosphate acetyl/butaryl transferase